MSPAREPFEDTSVPVDRSQSAIRKLLVDSGALAVRFGAGRFEVLGQDDDSVWRDPCVVEFVWAVERGQQHVRVQTHPKAPVKSGYRSSKQWQTSPEQRVRQAWRGLYWYLKGALDAARFGVIRFEDVFLSFIVTEGEGSPTVGDVLRPRIMSGAAALLEAGEPLEGEVVES